MTEKAKENKKLTRREFLKDAGLIAGGAALGSVALVNACGSTTTITAPGTTSTRTVTNTATTTLTGPGSTITTTVTGPGQTVTMPPVTTTVTAPPATITATAVKLSAPKFTIAYNPDVCCGCAACELFCAAAHGGKTGQSLARLTLDRPLPDLEFSVDTCRQCLAPSCMSVCVPNAITVDPQTGARLIDEKKCIGCGLCATACPFNVDAKGQATNTIVKLNNSTKKYFKCDLCTGRASGPACVEACPFGALSVKGQT